MNGSQNYYAEKPSTQYRIHLYKIPEPQVTESSSAAAKSRQEYVAKREKNFPETAFAGDIFITLSV